jgi:CBS-domain-containing membrane protein
MMLEHKIASLPVLGEDGQLVRLITQTDFLRVDRKNQMHGSRTMPHGSAGTCA